jgi:predicted enzyme related to lactoylglutathione lyase
MANPVVHFEILGKEPEKLQNFYSNLFAWKVNADNPDKYGLVDAADAGIGGGIGTTNLLAGHLTFYVEVDNLESYMEKAVGMGGRVMSQPMQSMGVRYQLFADPEGNVVGLVETGGSQ